MTRGIGRLSQTWGTFPACPISAGFEHDAIVLHEFFNRRLTVPSRSAFAVRFAIVSALLLTLAGLGENVAATGDLDITSDITIVGDSAANTIIDANHLDRVLAKIEAELARSRTL